MLEKSLHFPIKPGVVAAWNAHTVVIVCPTFGSSARVRVVATGEERDVAVDELQGIPAIGPIESGELRWGWFAIPLEPNGSKLDDASGC